MKILKWILVITVLLLIIFFLGPRAKYDAIDASPISFDIPLETLDEYIADMESSILDIKQGNEAKIVWFDSLRTKTEYAVVYLHGFSASREEGAPLHVDFASRYGMNLYLPRLFDHGRKSDDTFKNLLPEDLVNSAKEAIAVGKLLGDKVILMTCSTGGTLAAILASQDAAVHSVFMYSPNIDVKDPSSAIVTGPWGRQMLKIALGGEYNRIQYDSLAAQYWSEVYHLDGIIALKYLIEQEMNEKTFRKINLPVFLGYYYKDEENQDQVVSVERMLDFFDEIDTESELKRKIAFEDAGRHVMTSHVFSNNMQHVKEETYKFAEEVLALQPITAVIENQ